MLKCKWDVLRAGVCVPNGAGSCRLPSLPVPPDSSDAVGSKDDSRHFLPEKNGDKLLLCGIAVKVNLRIMCRIIKQDIRYYFTSCAAAHDDFIGPHR